MTLELVVRMVGILADWLVCGHLAVGGNDAGTHDTLVHKALSQSSHFLVVDVPLWDLAFGTVEFGLFGLWIRAEVDGFGAVEPVV